MDRNAVKKECATCGAEKNANRTKFSEFTYTGKRYKSNCKACRNAKQRAAWAKRPRKVRTREIEAIERNPHGFLAADIIEKAIRDWKKYSDLDVNTESLTDYGDIRALARQKGYGTIRDELLAFFASAWFEELCSMANSEPEYIRKHVLGNTETKAWLEE